MSKKKQQYWFGRDNTPDPGWFGFEESMDTVNNGKGWTTYSKRRSGKVNRFLSEKLGIGETDNEINARRTAAARRRLENRTKTNSKTKPLTNKNTVSKAKLERFSK